MTSMLIASSLSPGRPADAGIGPCDGPLGAAAGPPQRGRGTWNRRTDKQMTSVNFTRGANGKPVATQALEESLAALSGFSGDCFFGYPLIATPEGKYFLDATFVSPQKGVILFDLIEGTDVGDYPARQDDCSGQLNSDRQIGSFAVGFAS